MFNDTPFRHEAENSKENCSCGKNLRQCNCKSKSVDTLEQKPKNGFDAWVQVLEEEEQPVACSVDNPDCENCGS